jgi:potassium efflux system protein
MATIEAARSGREPGRDGRALSAERRDALAAEWHALDAQMALRRRSSPPTARCSTSASRPPGARHACSRPPRSAGAGPADQRSTSARSVQAEQTVQALAGDAGTTGTADSLLAREAATNQQLSEYLLRATDQLNTLTQRNLAVRQQLDALNRSNTVIDEQINVLQGSLLLSRILLEQKRALPQPTIDAASPSRSPTSACTSSRSTSSANSSPTPPPLPTACSPRRPRARPTVDARAADRAARHARELLERLNRELNTLLNESITLQLSERQLQATADRLRATLDEQMFWIPSNRPLDLAWLQAVPAQLTKQLAPSPGSRRRWSCGPACRRAPSCSCRCCC